MIADSSGTEIRPAAVDDHEPIALVHITALRETYEGVLPQSVLDGFSLPVRQTMWRHALERVPPMSVFVAQTDAGEIVGFVAGDLRRSDTLQRDAEIDSIYLLNKARQKGIGLRLMTAVVRTLREQGANSLYLWVPKANAAARRFYGRLGGQEIGERTETEAGQQLVEVAFGWDDLDALLTTLAGNS